jgi:hypothetical protein
MSGAAVFARELKTRIEIASGMMDSWMAYLNDPKLTAEQRVFIGQAIEREDETRKALQKQLDLLC